MFCLRETYWFSHTEIMFHVIYTLWTIGHFLLFCELYILFVVILINIRRRNNKVLFAFKQKEPKENILLRVFFRLFSYFLHYIVWLFTSLFYKEVNFILKLRDNNSSFCRLYFSFPCIFYTNYLFKFISINYSFICMVSGCKC